MDSIVMLLFHTTPVHDYPPSGKDEGFPELQGNHHHAIWFPQESLQVKAVVYCLPVEVCYEIYMQYMQL
jgi:hypothetical protein